MSGPLIILVGLIYLYIGIEQIFWLKNIGIGIAYICYAGSNVGLYLAAIGK